jgi:hypothetical protein
MPPPPHIGISNLFTPEKVKNHMIFVKKQHFATSSPYSQTEIGDPFDSKSAEHWEV